MAKNSVAGLLTSVDDLFSTQESRDEAKLERVINLPPGEISDFPNHPFKVRMDEEMQQMAESVKEHGVLVPALVREKPGGGYEMVAGHRRKRAAELAELPEIPCIVRNLTDDEAIIVMVDSNLQREKILPSEKAFAYKMRLEAMKRQAGRPRQDKLRRQWRLILLVDVPTKNLPNWSAREKIIFVAISASLIYFLKCWIWWTTEKSPSARLWNYPIWRNRNSIFCWIPCSARIAPRPTPKLSKCGSFRRRAS